MRALKLELREFFYRKWVKVGSGHYSEFQDLWEIVIIRSVREAICETIGSMINQHGGKNIGFLNGSSFRNGNFFTSKN